MPGCGRRRSGLRALAELPFSSPAGEPGPAHLGLGAVNAQLDVLGRRVDEQVLQGADPDAGLVGDGEAAGREQGPYLPHRRRDGGAVPWFSSANAACGSW